MKSNGIKLIFDLGTKIIKYILFHDNYIMTTGIINHDCISNNNIIKYNVLLHLIKNLHSELEVDYLSSIDNIIVSFDFGEIIVVNHQKSMKINGIITKEHHKELQYNNHNWYLLEIYNEKYIIDNTQFVLNPLDLHCKNISYSADMIYVNPIIFNQIQSLFSCFKNVKFYIGIIQIIKYLNKYHNEFILLDIGHTNSRLINQKVNKSSLNCYFNGMEYFNSTLKQNTIYQEEFPKIDIFQHKNLINSFFYNILPNNYNNNIFITGGSLYIPLLYDFLKQTFNWQINSITLEKRISNKYNSDLFLKCFLCGTNL